MKQMFFVAALLLATTIQAQTIVSASQPVMETIPTYSIQVTVNKTANLVFPYEVKSVDRGTEDLLVQKVPGAGHILQVKAASSRMPETNLSVVTADMRLYSFLVRFDSFPATLNYRLKTSARSPFNYSPKPETRRLNDAQIIEDAAQVEKYEPFIKRVQDSRYGAIVRVNGIYIHDDVLYFSFQLENETQINYDIESFQLFLRDQRIGKRTAQQEITLSSLYVYGDSAIVEANSSQRLVMAIPKFTIPDKKDCIIQLREAGGGRHLECRISNKLLIRCKSLSNNQ